MTNIDLKDYATAIHEAGHAVAIYHQSPRYFSIDLRADADEGMLQQGYLEFPRTVRDCELLAVQCLAGIKAESQFTRQSTPVDARSWNKDVEQAESILDLIDRKDSINEYMERARKFVIDHWSEITRLAEALVTHQKLDSFECAAILEEDFEWFDELRTPSKLTNDEMVNRKSFVSDPHWPEISPNTTTN